MRTDLPTGMKSSAQQLSPDAIVSLFKIELTNGSSPTVIYFTPHNEIAWLGNTYSEIPCTMAQMEQDAQGRANRPKFSFANPGGIFTSSIQQGYIDGAALTRFRILKADLDANIDAKVTEKFFVSKVLMVNKDIVSVELRDVFDGHMFKFPARSYYPPEFPNVSLF